MYDPKRGRNLSLKLFEQNKTIYHAKEMQLPQFCVIFLKFSRKYKYIGYMLIK